MSLLEKIRNKLMHLRLQPIRVFCFHQVSDEFDPKTTWECDWMPTNKWKEQIEELQRQGYEFISLVDAYQHIQHDKRRRKKYAVLTMDDASNSIVNLMPWLAERGIPVTLFIPPAFLNAEVTHKCGTSLTEDQLNTFLEQYPSYVTVANHGYNHIVATLMKADEFIQEINHAESFLAKYKQKIPFFAYPGGRHSYSSDVLVRKMGLVPVYCDGQVNNCDYNVIHREILK